MPLSQLLGDAPPTQYLICSCWLFHTLGQPTAIFCVKKQVIPLFPCLVGAVFNCAVCATPIIGRESVTGDKSPYYKPVVPLLGRRCF